MTGNNNININANTKITEKEVVVVPIIKYKTIIYYPTKCNLSILFKINKFN